MYYYTNKHRMALRAVKRVVKGTGSVLSSSRRFIKSGASDAAMLIRKNKGVAIALLAGGGIATYAGIKGRNVGEVAGEVVGGAAEIIGKTTGTVVGGAVKGVTTAFDVSPYIKYLIIGIVVLFVAREIKNLR